MPKELLREIRKLEVRLKHFVQEEKNFLKELTTCLEKLRELNNHLERKQIEDQPKGITKLVHLRLETIEALSSVLKKGSIADHEKSHLLESYGSILQALEQEFNEILLTVKS